MEPSTINQNVHRRQGGTQITIVIRSRSKERLGGGEGKDTMQRKLEKCSK